MRKMNKILCCILSIAMLLTVLPSSLTSVSAALKMETKDGYLDFEAEDTTYDKTKLKLVKDKKLYSGGQALSVPEEDKPEPAADAPAHIDLSFKADVGGTYTIWMRNTASVKSEAGQSIYFSYGGKDQPYTWTKINGEPEEPAWTKLCSMNVGAGETGYARLRVRQMLGIAFDRFIITNDTSFKPDDVTLGLAEATPTPSPVSTPSADKVAIKTEKGNAVVEAEKLSYNKTRFTAVDNKDASGKKALAVQTEDKTEPPATQAADLDVSFVADAAGTYTVWMRNTATQENSSGNSIFLSVGSDEYKYFVIQGTPEEFAWTKLGSVTVNSAGGVGLMRIIARQSYNISIDKFIVTSNRAFNPEGVDPDPTQASVSTLPSGAYPTPSVTPPASHPRVFFTAADIPTLKANLDAEQNAEAKAAWEKAMQYASDGTMPQPEAGKSNFDYKLFNAIEAKAYDYALNKNTEHGKSAIEMMKNALATADFVNDQFAVRAYGRMIMTVGKVYDWCYDLISDDDKKLLIANTAAHASHLSVGYPPNKMGAIVGHGAEGQLLQHLMSFAIATYNEQPDIYNYVAGRFFAEYIEPRDYYYESGSYHQGSSYARYGNDIACAWMFKRMSGVEVFDDNFHKVFYELLYRRRPDGQNLRTGDDFNEYGNSRSTFWPSYYSTLLYGSSYYNDPYLKREAEKCSPNLASFPEDTEGTYTPTMHLILNDPNLRGKSNAALPLTSYYGSPNGAMIARTGWDDGYDSPDAIAYMKIGERWAANHEHLDAGNFQIYYKGILASESGYYGSGYGSKHDYNYHKRGIAHNILTIYDPDEQMNYYGAVANDGGQKTPMNGTEPTNMEQWMNDGYVRASVTAHEYGPDPVTPEYSYLAGDITKAYSEKVDEVLRSMVFLPLEDSDHPATFIVMDKVTSANEAFQKSWLLHMQEEPQVDGNKIIVTRTEGDYNGRMVNETLLPKSVDITKIGGEGKEFMIGETNYDYTVTPNAAAEVGWGRVEVSPSEANKTDYFLNVMTVSDADTTAADLTSTLIEGDNYAGAVISDRVAVFAKDKDRIAGSLSFDIPGSGDYKVFVAGLTAGTWTTSTGEEVIVTEDGSVAYFTAPAGTVTLTYKDTNANRGDVNLVLQDVETIGVKVGGMYIYSDVPAFIENDRTLVPMRAIFEALGAEVEWDGETATATASKDGRVVKITEGSNIAYIDDVAQELDVTAVTKNDRFVVPVRFVSEAFNAKVVWDGFSESVLITPGIIIKPNENSDIASIIRCETSGDFNNEIGEYSFDGDVDTLWSVEGDDQWIVYEFDKEYTVESMYIYLNKATERIAYFDVLASTDGVTYTPVITDGAANGKTAGETVTFPSPVKAKYIKYMAKGNNTSKWNAIKEIQFNVQK